MPYTLVKWLLWLLLAALVGGVIGYLLRGVRCRAELARARATTVDEEEVLALRRRVANLELTVADRNRFKAERDDLRQQLKQRAAVATLAAADAVPSAPVAPVLDDAALARGAEVLGRSVVRDDLTMVEGVGPKIAELLQAAGITTWWGLATGGVEPVQAALTAAGPRYQMHDPATWPTQADLLANGRWEEFKELTDRLDGGRDA